MRKGLWLATSLLAIMALIASGCSEQPTEQPTESIELPTEQPTEQPAEPTELPIEQPSEQPAEPPKGMESPRELTDEEKMKVVEIALNSPRALEWLEQESEYRIRGPDWYAIVWKSSGGGWSQWQAFPYYDVETDTNRQLVPESAAWYPGVSIDTGEDIIMLMQIAVDLETETTVMSFGPNPSPSSPGRFRQGKAEPTVDIMVKSDTVEAGSSFMLSGSNFEPNQKVWIDIEFRGRYGLQVYCEADEDGSVHTIIQVPRDTVPGDYEVNISTGEYVHDRQLLTTVLIYIQ